MSKAEYPNRDALDDALQVYLQAMYSFVSECLDEELLRKALRLPSDSNIEEEIEVKDIAHLIRPQTRWENYFKEKFKVIDRYGKTRYYDAQSVASLIVEGRNQVSHQLLKELDRDFTRCQLFLIVEILGKINNPDAQRRVENIRAELFNDTAEQLKAVSKAVEAKEAEYEKSIAEIEKRLAAEEAINKELSKKVTDNAAKLDEKTKDLEKRAGQLVSVKLSKQECEKQRDSISKQLEKMQTARSACDERITTISNQLTAAEAERDDYKERFETASKELEEAETEWQACGDSLAAMRKLFTVATIGDQTVQDVYPSIEKDSTVRILDRRGVKKKNYLLGLLEQKQPTIIYVQSEEMVDLLLERVVPEKANLIEKYGGQTSEAEEMEILEKLANGELIAVVSDTTFSTLVESHCVEHFVFCHLAPSLDEFFERSQSAFASERNAYLHLIYESEQDIKEITKKYLDEPTLRKLYEKFRDCTPTVGKSIKPDDLYSELCKQSELKITELGIETSLSIFEELGFLKQNEEGIIRVSPPSGKTKLEKSGTYCRGEKLKKEIANSPAFQYEQSIKQIWEEILEKPDVDGEQILREDNIDEMYSNVSEIENDLQPAEAVENDSEADDRDTEAGQTSKPARANAEVNEELVRAIRSRSTAGEANSELAEEDSEKKPEVKQSEFWRPIRAGEFGALFAGKPVPVRDDGWISKQIRGVELILSFRQNRSYVSFLCKGENRMERRDEIIALFSEADYDYSPHESPQRAGFRFPVINKGKDHPEDWDEIRKKLVAMGTDIYNKIDESDL